MKKRQQKRDHHQQNEEEDRSVVELRVHGTLDRDADAGGNSRGACFEDARVKTPA